MAPARSCPLPCARARFPALCPSLGEGAERESLGGLERTTRYFLALVRDRYNTLSIRRGALGDLRDFGVMASGGGAEWAFFVVVRKADKGKVPRVDQVAGFVGTGADQAYCLFCERSLAALVDRLRGHLGGRPGEVFGVTACPGPAQRAGESAEDFAQRKTDFTAAQLVCRKKIEELRVAAESKKRRELLDQATAPESYVPAGPKARPLKQKTLDENTAAHVKVTDDLARGLFSASTWKW